MLYLCSSMTIAYCLADVLDNSFARASASVFRSNVTNAGGVITVEAMDGSYSDRTRS
jgi:hypothetical protein